jgi:hypothetical protein
VNNRVLQVADGKYLIHIRPAFAASKSLLKANDII